MMDLSEMPMEEARMITRHRKLKEYGESLLQRRKDLGFTRVELSERTGVSTSDISKAELGVFEISEEQKERISKCLMLKEYGESILRRRKDRGITKIELFERTGVRISDISKAELGLLELSEEQKLKISTFLRRQHII